MSRDIAVVTTSRADYSHLFWVLRDLEEHPEIQLHLIAIAAHLSTDFGSTVEQIERDGFSIAATVATLDSSDSDAAMARTIGQTTLGLTEVLADLDPDLLLLIADRYELLAPASVALALRIPIAHIEGGDVSQGAIDDAVRNAITKLSHVHFTPTETAARRVIAMGEEEWRVHRTGAPSLDHLRRSSIPERAIVEAKLGLSVRPGTILIAYHPVTIARDTLREVDEIFAALEQIESQKIFCFPNADAGSRQLASRLQSFCEGRPDADLFVNLEPTLYWGLLKSVDLVVGNSSSGIMETPSLRLPAVNVGMRQQGRERARNIIDCQASPEAILAAVASARSQPFRASLEGMINPYGDGHAAERIVSVLAKVRLGEELLVKRPAPIGRRGPSI